MRLAVGLVLGLAGCEAPPDALGPYAGYVQATCATVADSLCVKRRGCAGSSIPVELCAVDEARACVHALWVLPIDCQLVNAEAMQLCALEQGVQSCSESCGPLGDVCAKCGIVRACE